MSTNYVTIVPKKSGFLPLPENQDAALHALRIIAPEAEDISIIRHENIEFFDCGENFLTVGCPQCGSEIDVSLWGDLMTKDYVYDSNISKNKIGFQLLKYVLPCCQNEASLDELIYEYPQAFGRFGISGMNCNIDSLSSDQIAILQLALKCDVTVVYQHL